MLTLYLLMPLFGLLFPILISVLSNINITLLLKGLCLLHILVHVFTFQLSVSLVLRMAVGTTVFHLFICNTILMFFNNRTFNLFTFILTMDAFYSYLCRPFQCSWLDVLLSFLFYFVYPLLCLLLEGQRCYLVERLRRCLLSFS